MFSDIGLGILEEFAERSSRCIELDEFIVGGFHEVSEETDSKVGRVRKWAAENADAVKAARRAWLAARPDVKSARNKSYYEGLKSDPERYRARREKINAARRAKRGQKSA